MGSRHSACTSVQPTQTIQSDVPVRSVGRRLLNDHVLPLTHQTCKKKIRSCPSSVIPMPNADACRCRWRQNLNGKNALCTSTSLVQFLSTL